MRIAQHDFIPIHTQNLYFHLYLFPEKGVIFFSKSPAIPLENAFFSEKIF